jgi:hypothetical protein
MVSGQPKPPNIMMKEMMKKKDSKDQAWIPFTYFSPLADKGGNINYDCQTSNFNNNNLATIQHLWFN